MDFAPIELCEKLHAMGCLSETDFYYCDGFELPQFIPDLHSKKYLISCFAFVQNDFTGATDQADRNCSLVFPKGKNGRWTIQNPGGLIYCPDCCLIDIWLHHKHEMMDCHRANHNGSREVWDQYLERTMEKGGSL